MQIKILQTIVFTTFMTGMVVPFGNAIGAPEQCLAQRNCASCCISVYNDEISELSGKLLNTSDKSKKKEIVKQIKEIQKLTSKCFDDCNARKLK